VQAATCSDLTNATRATERALLFLSTSITNALTYAQLVTLILRQITAPRASNHAKAASVPLPTAPAAQKALIF
jgi:hypothetical protein